jgi:hypothetical protein
VRLLDAQVVDEVLQGGGADVGARAVAATLERRRVPLKVEAGKERCDFMSGSMASMKSTSFCTAALLSQCKLRGVAG